jgi:hypothetical protein
MIDLGENLAALLMSRFQAEDGLPTFMPSFFADVR